MRPLVDDYKRCKEETQIRPRQASVHEYDSSDTQLIGGTHRRMSVPDYDTSGIQLFGGTQRVIHPFRNLLRGTFSLQTTRYFSSLVCKKYMLL